jgi:hypothetical protein
MWIISWLAFYHVLICDYPSYTPLVLETVYWVCNQIELQWHFARWEDASDYACFKK